MVLDCDKNTYSFCTHRIFKIFFGVFCVFAIAFHGTLFSQNRPKIGVVLSGGGAKGMAHIGVLQALEEANIPIDYIAGTSIGAIVGGLYAAGYSPKEIKSIFLQPEFNSWLTDNMDISYSMRYMQPPMAPGWLTIHAEVDNTLRLKLPYSLISGALLDYAFLEIMGGATAASKGDFDSLMIPFFCIASDIESHSPVLLSEGDLGRAIRASMTFPFYFAPVKVNGKLLFDGGMYNNFPVEDMKKRHNPDFIIGCKVAGNFPPPQKGNWKSLLQNMVTTYTEYAIPKDIGYLIEPQLPPTNVVDFSLTEQFINIGYGAAKKEMDSLLSILALTDTVNSIAKKRTEFNAKKPPMKISMIDIEGLNPHQVSYFRNTIQGRIKNKNISVDEFRPHYFRLYSDLQISDIFPTLVYNGKQHSYSMNINMERPQRLEGKFGGCISSAPVSHIFLGGDYSLLERAYWRFHANVFMGKHYYSGHISTRVDIPTSLPFYLQLSFTGNRWNYFKLKGAFFDYSARNYLVQEEQNIVLKTGIPLGINSFGELKFAYGNNSEQYYNRDYVDVSDTTDESSFHHFVIGLSSEYNTLNHKIYPTTGTYVRGVVQYIMGKETFVPGTTSILDHDIHQNHQWFQIQAKLSSFKQISKYWYGGISAEGFCSFQDRFATYTSTLLNAGDFHPTFQSQTEFYPEYRTNQYFALGIHQIFSLGLFFVNTSLRLDAYVFAPAQEILIGDAYTAMFSNQLFTKQYLLTSTSLVFNTKKGALSFCLGYNKRRDEGKSPWSFMINFGYLLFNNRAIER